MNLLYYECFAGISGDMNLAAMIDLGVPEVHLKKELEKLGLEGYEIHVDQELKMGIYGTKVNVEDKIHNHGHSHGHGHNHSHDHRTYKEIKEIILKCDLDDATKTTSINIFEKVAVAEAKIHNKTTDDVHFHEVGAIDSIVDIVGAAICYHYLSPKKVICSTIELGGGFVNCAHGKFPVPAPATTEILKGLPVKLGTVNVETTTPTGAAILATLVDEFTDTPEIKINKTSYGIGHRNMEIPNVLRVHDADLNTGKNRQKALMVECNLDDMSPEHFGFLMERLLEQGAHDVFLTPIIMKKTRPATKLSVLCSEDNAKKFKDIIFSETTTLGIRSYELHKDMLERKIETIQTQYGPIDIKISGTNINDIKAKPEFEQCKMAAVKYNVPLRLVVEEALKEYNSKS